MRTPKTHISFDIGRDKDDCEKAVTPVIIFINVQHPSFEINKDKSMKGFMIAIGWWDFSIKLFYIKYK